MYIWIPIIPVVLQWKVLLPEIGPLIYQPSPNVTMQILDRADHHIRFQSTHMKGTGNIVYSHRSNDKANECSTHGSSCPAEVQISVFTLFASLDIRKEIERVMGTMVLYRSIAGSV